MIYDISELVLADITSFVRGGVEEEEEEEKEVEEEESLRAHLIHELHALSRGSTAT